MNLRMKQLSNWNVVELVSLLNVICSYSWILSAIASCNHYTLPKLNIWPFIFLFTSFNCLNKQTHQCGDTGSWYSLTLAWWMTVSLVSALHRVLTHAWWMTVSLVSALHRVLTHAWWMTVSLVSALHRVLTHAWWMTVSLVSALQRVMTGTEVQNQPPHGVFCRHVHIKNFFYVTCY